MIKSYGDEVIMKSSRHQFLYAYDTEERKKFLRKIASDNPVKIEQAQSAVLLFSDYGLEDVPITRKDVDKYVLSHIAERYFRASLVELILTNIDQDTDIHFNEYRFKKFLTFINRFSKINGEERYHSYHDLLEKVRFHKQYYHQFYLDYISGKKNEIEIKPLLFDIDIERFIEEVQRFLRNRDPFIILIDKDKKISPYSTMAINQILGARLDNTLALKIVLEDGMWESFYDTNGQFIQDPHDYETVCLDESHREYINRLLAVQNPAELDARSEKPEINPQKCQILKDPDIKDGYIILGFDNNGVAKIIKIYPELTRYDSFIYVKGYICDMASKDLKLAVNSDDIIYPAIVNLANSLNGNCVVGIEKKKCSGRIHAYYNDNQAIFNIQANLGRRKYFEFQGNDTTYNIYVNALVNFYCEISRLAEEKEIDADVLQLFDAEARKLS